MSKNTTPVLIMGLAAKPAITRHVCSTGVYAADERNMSWPGGRRKYGKGFTKATSVTDVGLDIGQLTRVVKLCHQVSAGAVSYYDNTTSIHSSPTLIKFKGSGKIEDI